MRGSTLIHCFTVFVLLTAALFADPFTIIDPYPGDKYTSNGVSWGDWNNDGYMDVFVGNGAVYWPKTYKHKNFLYKNNGDGSFIKITGQTIVTAQHLTGGGTWGDYDNDGDLDIYITTNDNNSSGTDAANFLYINDGYGNFSESTTAGPPITDKELSNAAGWGDYDNDGDLDLFVKNGWQMQKKPHSLYRNDGSGTFTDIDAGDMTGDAGKSFISGLSWCDFDMDGDLDVFICDGGAAENFLWRNDNGTFVSTGSFTSNFSNGASWGDYDNDGDFDLFIANYGDSGPADNELWDNNDDGSFTKNTTSILSNDGGLSFGSAWGDIDNDGDLDLFVANDEAYNTNPNFLYINNGDGTFTKNTTSVAVTDPASQAPHGVAFADYNNDGFLDMFAAVHGANFMLVNNGNANNWLIVDLEGTVSNKSAIGAKVWATATINGSTVTQLREVSSQTGFASQNSMRAHFGFGSSTTISELKIEFPSGTIVTKTNVTSNQILSVSEAEGPISVKLASFEAHRSTDGAVVLEWKTAAEMNTAGFFIQRSSSKTSGYERINQSIIMAKGSSSLGSEYVFVDESISEFGNYYYRLEELTLEGESVVMEPVSISVTSSIGEASTPQGFRLAQNYPNPFNPTTNIEFELPVQTNVRLAVYDLRGALVQTLVDGIRNAGAHSIQWNGMDENGELVGSGLYIYKLRTGESTLTRKMVLAK